jgi:chemosensory pili system protein ChpA (sensor histidine kinase/response regulator)
MTKTATVMVIDDDADIRELMKMFLEADGYRVNVAKDGLDAIEQLQAGARPAVILLDLMLPRMDGEQFLKRMRAGRFGKIPVVVVSGHNAAQQKAVEIHAASCLEKPVELDELLKTVRRFACAA